MKISFLVPDIGGPVLGPVTVLARTLQTHYDVEIVGPDFGSGVCGMYRGSFDYKTVSTPRLYRFPNYFFERARLAEAVTGDVVVAVKAFADTVPVAWQLKKKYGRKMVVYLDEWDGALYQRLRSEEKVARWIRHFHHPMDDVYCPIVERLIPRADQVISTSTFLQHKFGGRIVHMGVDTNYFKPQPGTDELRRTLGLEGRKLIVFGGVVRPHKGLEQIPAALALLKREECRFVIVGPKNEHVEELLAHREYGPYIVALGPQPKDQMPRYLDLADLVILPLVDNLLARSQMPCKIFEAMAMAKPIIATDISDLPLVLDGGGWVVPPGDVPALAEKMRFVFDHPDQARAMGEAARAKCIRLYSKEQTDKALVEIMAGLTA